MSLKEEKFYEYLSAQALNATMSSIGFEVDFGSWEEPVAEESASSILLRLRV